MRNATTERPGATLRPLADAEPYEPRQGDVWVGLFAHYAAWCSTELRHLRRGQWPKFVSLHRPEAVRGLAPPARVLMHAHSFGELVDQAQRRDLVNDPSGPRMRLQAWNDTLAVLQAIEVELLYV